MSTIDNPDKFADKFRVKSSRLTNWDYSSSGYYFITICTLNHNNFFGKIIDNKIVLLNKDEIAKQELLKTFEIRKNIKLDEWVIMPNHLHLLINVGDFHVETRCNASLQQQSKITLINYGYKKHPNYFPRLNKKSNQIIPSTIRSFKQSVKRECNKQKLFFGWQARYFDEIIDSEKRLMIIKNYIKNNIINWERDKLYSEL